MYKNLLSLKFETASYFLKFFKNSVHLGKCPGFKIDAGSASFVLLIVILT